MAVMCLAYKKLPPVSMSTFVHNEFAALVPNEKTNWRLLPKERLYESETLQGSNLEMLKNMLIESLRNMDRRNSYDNDSKKKKKRKDQEELHSSPSKLPGNSRESEKENPLHPFSNCDYVACRFLSGTDPITCKELEKNEQKNRENGHERKAQR